MDVIATFLKHELRRRNLSRNRFARSLGLKRVDHKVIKLVEDGRLRPLPEELEAMARALNVSPPEALLQPVTVILPEALLKPEHVIETTVR